MKQIVVEGTDADRVLALHETPEPLPEKNQALIAVRAVSLNRGEVARALQRAQAGWTPGWDFAGVVVRGAADGRGPQTGARVAGMLEGGAWAERVVADPAQLAVVPDDVSLETAAALPVAGLTALYALEKGGGLLGKEVLITGATGGMGQFAVQLAVLAGANVTAAVHRNTFDIPARAAHRVRILRTDAAGLAELRSSRFNLIIESVGGAVFAAAAQSLAPGGTLISLGATADNEARFDIRAFFNIGGASIYGFNVFEESMNKPVSQGLETLLRLVAGAELHVPLRYRGEVHELDAVARRLLSSQLPGKAVLTWAA